MPTGSSANPSLQHNGVVVDDNGDVFVIATANTQSTPQKKRFCMVKINKDGTTAWQKQTPEIETGTFWQTYQLNHGIIPAYDADHIYFLQLTLTLETAFGKSKNLMVLF